jgi:hypothetical protein
VKQKILWELQWAKISALCKLQDVICRNYIWVYIFENRNSLDSATRNILEYTGTLVTRVGNINRVMDEGET